MARVLVTGATSGLGESLTQLLVENGHHVIACGRNQEKLDDLAKHEQITSLAFDSTNVDETAKALDDVKADIYVLNAGTCEYVDIRDIEADMFKRVFDANVIGTVNTFTPLFKNAEKGSKFVIVDSLARLLPFPRSEAYGASKAALYYMTKSFAVDAQRKGIKVVSMSPGFVETPLTDKNDFPMPMKITSAEAAEYMMKGIFSSTSSIYFPRRFSFIIRTLNLLPEFIQHKLCVGMTKNMKRKQ